ncbi:MAG TPA: hypothetical protein DCQ16_04935 [Spirochaetaceae bacterium]|nr:hypothetical protein [Spirochaetaceae bacterium]
MYANAARKSKKIAIQLMISPGQMEKFSENEIVERLDFSLEALEPDELILSIHEDYGDLARKIVEHCGGKNVNVSLWTMVFADRAASLSRLPLVRDFKGREGYGAIAAWNGMGKGDEKFLFCCPSAMLDDDKGILRAVEAAQEIGAQGVFLDRIRYPSPANGLEYLGACSCSACTKAFYRDNGMDWPDLVREMVNWAACGREGAVKFRDAHKPAREFRAKMVATAVSRYSEAVHGAGLRVGLDLLAPALSDIVGQDYALLSRNADFIKPMLYCKASAPAGLPLEFRLLMEGLSRSGVETSRARQFVAELSGIEDEHLKAVQLGGSFPAGLAASQMSRAKREADGRNDHRADVYAGIELVDHEDYETKINEAARDAYLEALSRENIALCWNILYIPRNHIMAVAKLRKDFQ